jgi:hypothetical protein
MNWRDHADQVEPAEDRLIDRYRDEFFKGRSPASDRGYETTQTPSGIGRRFYPAMYVTAIERRSAWPETQMVLDMFWESIPDRHFVVLRAIWPPDRWFDDEPPYNDLYWANLAEHIHTRTPGGFACSPGRSSISTGATRSIFNTRRLTATLRRSCWRRDRKSRTLSVDGSGCRTSNAEAAEPVRCVESAVCARTDDAVGVRESTLCVRPRRLRSPTFNERWPELNESVGADKERAAPAAVSLAVERGRWFASSRQSDALKPSRGGGS